MLVVDMYATIAAPGDGTTAASASLAAAAAAKSRDAHHAIHLQEVTQRIAMTDITARAGQPKRLTSTPTDQEIRAGQVTSVTSRPRPPGNTRR